MGASPPPFVTVVTGVPRSGTSMMMQMLRAGGLAILSDDERGPDDDNPRGYLEYGPARRLDRDASWLPGAVGRAVKVVHTLASALPVGGPYRVVLMRRDLGDVMTSQARMLARRGEAVDAAGDVGLTEVFAAQLDALGAWAASRRDVALFVCHYEATLRDPRGIAAKLADFLDGAVDAAAMAAAVEPALCHHQRGVGVPVVPDPAAGGV